MTRTNLLQLESCVVVHTNGHCEAVELGKGFYDAICEKVASPFDLVTIIPGHLMAFVDDEFLLKEGMDLNVPMALTFGVVLGGPVMLVGPPDSEGDTTNPQVPEDLWMKLGRICMRLFEAHVQLAKAKEGPFFEIVPVDDIGEALEKILGGSDG